MAKTGKAGIDMSLITLGDVIRWMRLHVKWDTEEDEQLADQALEVLHRFDRFIDRIDDAVRERDGD